MHIREIRWARDHGIVLFNELTDRTMADRFTGGQIAIEEKKLAKLPDDAFYVRDVIGLEVMDENEQYIGIVTNILNMPAHDVYEIETAQGKKLIPAVQAFIRKIDLERRLVSIHVIPGLLD